MQGTRRKIVHAVLYEAIAIVVVTVVLLPFTEHGAASTGALSALLSVCALLWNMGFNAMFEAWERQQVRKGRTLARRAAHALLFEFGLAVLTIPVVAWWLGIGWWEAVLLDLGLMLLFMVYTFCFNWVFDRVFGLPASAQATSH